MISGIYKIENTENGKVYIGSSKNIPSRWEQHRKQLTNRSHHNAKLQHAWNKSGGKLSLDYSILEECDIDCLMDREQFWMDHYDAFKSGYNCTRLARGCPNPVKTSVWIKSEPKLQEVFQNLYEFDLRRNNPSVNQILVSHFGLKIGKASSASAFIERLRKATCMMLKIADQLENLDRSVEYRLHYIHYLGKHGGFEITPEYNESKNSKYSQHNRVKADNILNRLWDEVLEECFTGRTGKGIKERYNLYLEGVDIDGE